MGISGNLRTMQLAELLQWLSMGQKTGTLRIEKSSSQVTKRIFFDGGSILSSASTDPGEYLGRFLVSHGYLEEQQVNEAVARQKEEGRLLGKILTDMGLISEDNLYQMLRLKAEESIYDIFTWEEGAFEFLDDELPAEHMIRMELDVQWIVLEGTRRNDEWSRIQQLVPSPQHVPVLVVDIDGLELEDFDRSILEWVDDDRTVEEISEGAMTALFQVSEIFARSVTEGWLKMVRPRVVEVPVPAEAEAAPTPMSDATDPAETVAEPPSPAPPAQPLPDTPETIDPKESGTFYHSMMQQMMAQLQQQQAMQAQAMQAQAMQAQALQAAPQPPIAAMPAPQPQPAAPPVDLGEGRSLSFATDGAASTPSVAPAPAAAPVSSPASEAIDVAEEALARKDFESALGSYRRALEAEGAAGVSDEASAGIAKLERALEREGIGLSSAPKLRGDISELMKLNISPQEGFLLSRLDGTTDLRTLLRMTQVPKVDAFLLFWKLRDSGHVMI